MPAAGNADNLDVLLETRLGLCRADIIAALQFMPPTRSHTAELTEHDTRLLDDAAFTADPETEVAATFIRAARGSSAPR